MSHYKITATTTTFPSSYWTRKIFIRKMIVLKKTWSTALQYYFLTKTNKKIISHPTTKAKFGSTLAGEQNEPQTKPPQKHLFMAHWQINTAFVLISWLSALVTVRKVMQRLSLSFQAIGLDCAFPCLCGARLPSAISHERANLCAALCVCVSVCMPKHSKPTERKEVESFMDQTVS